MDPRVNVDRERLAAFCRRHHIRKLSFFGSVLRDDFRPDSDVDVLFEFQPGHVSRSEPGHRAILITRVGRIDAPAIPDRSG